jgi:uncharacterized membrane protein YbhN (UPF0104 family)
VRLASAERADVEEASPARADEAPGGRDEARRLWTGMLSVAAAGLLLGALVLAVPGLHDVLARIEGVAPGWIALAIGLELVSCAGFVLAFRHVFARLPGRLATRVALTELAFTAVVPAGGAGGIAAGAWIANVKGAPVKRFLERSGVLFLLTSAVNAGTLALAGLLVFAGVLGAPGRLLPGLVPGVAGLLAIGAFALLPLLARRLRGEGKRARALRTSARVVTATRAELRRPTLGLAGAIAYLWADIAMLWVCFRAFGEALPIGAVTLAFLIGYLANVVPVPGGIGALDGGLVAALVAYGAHPASAAAAVLLYHAIVFWIPALIGTAAYLRLRSSLGEPLVVRAPANVNGAG